jgi:hypothetical protein
MENIRLEILKRFRIEYSVCKINHQTMGLVQEVDCYIAASPSAKNDSKYLSIPADLMNKLVSDTSKVVLNVKKGSTDILRRYMYLTVGGNYVVHAETNMFGKFCLSDDVADIHELGLSSSPEPLTLYINDVEIGTLPDKALTGCAKLNCEDKHFGVTYSKLRKYRKQLHFPKMKNGKQMYSGVLSAVDGKWNIRIG